MGLRALLEVLRRRAGMILLGVVLAAGVTFAISSVQHKKYEAKATLLLKNTLASQTFGSSLQVDNASPTSTPERDAATTFQLASQPVIADNAAANLIRRHQPIAAKAVENNATVSSENQSDVYDVKVTAPSATAAAAAANEFAAQFIAFRRQTDQANIVQSQRLLQHQSNRLEAQRKKLLANGTTTTGTTSDSLTLRQLNSQIRDLSNRADDLSTLASLQTGNAVVIQAATPPVLPSSPKPVRNAIIAGFAGLLLGLGLALMREQLDHRMRNSSDLETAFGLPVLARLPKSRALARRSSVPQRLPGVEQEAFRILRANLRYLHAGGELNSVLVTSPTVEEGKSTVSFNLAAAVAATGVRVLLIEGDLRKPRLARMLGLSRNFGLSALLSGKRQHLEEVVHQIPVSERMNGSGSARTMDVLLAGPPARNPSELLDSDRMREVLTEAEDRYDLVIIDTPPATVVSDAIPLMKHVNAVLVVGRIGKLTANGAARLREQLEKVQAPTIGVVANFTTLKDGGYTGGGYYHTGKNARSEAEAEAGV